MLVFAMHENFPSYFEKQLDKYFNINVFTDIKTIRDCFSMLYNDVNHFISTLERTISANDSKYAR